MNTEAAKFSMRQSTLRSFETCARRTWHDIQAGEDSVRGYTEATAALGSVFHLIAAEILRTLHRTGGVQMPTQEAMEVAYEIYAACDYVLPADERDSLRTLVLNFCQEEWNTKAILAVERQLSADIVCQDGVTRTITGSPDMIMADPPVGLLIHDWKTGLGKPRTPRVIPDDGIIRGKEYLSERGHFQGDSYCFLALRKYPLAEYATFREKWWRMGGEPRQMTLGRDEMEHVERELGVQLMKMDRGLQEGEASDLWRPRPGRHCSRQCAVARSCPVPEEQRGAGAVEDQASADAQAARLVVLEAVRDQVKDGLRSYFLETGNAPVLPDGRSFRWDGGKGAAFEIVDPS